MGDEVSSTGGGSAASAKAGSKAGGSSYGQILKSSALVGGSKVVDVLVGMVRVKVMAVLLGPAGFGLMGFFTSITDMTRSVSGMGINTSGVRQIAEAVGSGDAARVARTVTVLRRVSVLLGALGAVFLLVFCRQVSEFTFQTGAYAWSVTLLGVAVFIRTVSDAQGALIQGTRRIAELALCSVLGSVLGTLLTVPLLYFFREQGVVPSLIAVAAMTFCLTWWFSRRVGIPSVPLRLDEMKAEVGTLLRLGVAFMASGLLMLGSMYVIRLIVAHHPAEADKGLELAGYYGAAWAMGGLYIGTILEAMGADFYPRLTGLAQDHAACNRAVNEQAEISLLLAGPGVLVTMTLAPFVLTLFYSARFEVAVDLPGHDAAGDLVADGFHRAGEGAAAAVLLE
jgi:PST family polysaccharide transporter